MADRNFHVACACLQGKKDACQIFNNILRRQIGTRSPTVEYFCSHQEVLFILLKGCVSHTHTHTHIHRIHSLTAAAKKRWHKCPFLKVRDAPSSLELWDHAAGVHPLRAAGQDNSSFRPFPLFLQLRGDVHLRHRLRRLRHLQGTSSQPRPSPRQKGLPTHSRNSGVSFIYPSIIYSKSHFVRAGLD